MSLPPNTNGRAAVVDLRRQQRSAPNGPIRCPHCGRPAIAEDRFYLYSADEPVQRVKVSCAAGHWLIAHLGVGESRWTAP